MKTSARSHIAMEILQTEKAYVEFLRTLQEVYEIPLKSGVGAKKGQLMDQHEVSVCFGLLAPIYLGAGEFLVKLTNLMDRFEPDKTVLSSLFLSSEAYFQDYAPYVNSYTEISRLVHKLMEVSLWWVFCFFFSFDSVPFLSKRATFARGSWSNASYLVLLTSILSTF